MSNEDFIYLGPVVGRVVPRYGKQSFIGAVFERSKEDGSQGFKINTSKIVAIPRNEYRRYLVEYRRAISDGSLVPKTKEEYDAQLSARSASEDTKPEAPLKKKKGGDT